MALKFVWPLFWIVWSVVFAAHAAATHGHWWLVIVHVVLVGIWGFVLGLKVERESR